MSQIAAKQKTDKPTVASYSSSLYGEIINKNNRHIANVSVMLLRKKDSSLVRGVISSDSGKFVFENISVGVYVVAASITGYKVAFLPYLASAVLRSISILANWY